MEVGSEGAELEEVSELPSEEVEVLEMPLEVLGEVLGWKECGVVLDFIVIFCIFLFDIKRLNISCILETARGIYAHMCEWGACVHPCGM